ncbi:hypothetical protein [Dictyobacter formicarum]|uniref:Uncharacterized protein n=1 Tax=Dictyobacter formicarum TaxID=2778368 RepID=A0ABQ3VJQ6_9CHLR|nr:hypothetical protein [Dictyobacter formicarum]GHO85896.1 hypothetical protein KSZ_39020 [Dictyobacter formicarum]
MAYIEDESHQVIKQGNGKHFSAYILQLKDGHAAILPKGIQHLRELEDRAEYVPRCATVLANAMMAGRLEETEDEEPLYPGYEPLPPEPPDFVPPRAAIVSTLYFGNSLVSIQWKRARVQLAKKWKRHNF